MRDVERDLEHAYRRLVLAYPASWRRRHGDALLGLLLEQADTEDRRRISGADVRDVVGQGLMTRARLVARFVPAPARQAASVLALGTGAGICLALLVLGEWLPWLLGRDLADVEGMGPARMTLGVPVYVLWLLAAVSLAHRRSSRLLLGSALATAVLLVLLVSNDYPHGSFQRPSAALLVFLAVLGTLALVGRRPSPLPVAAVAAVTAGVFILPLLQDWGMQDHQFRHVFYYSSGGSLGWGAAATAALCFGVALVLALARRLKHAAGALLTGLPWTAYGQFEWSRQYHASQPGPEIGACALAALLILMLLWQSHRSEERQDPLAQ